ncbi:proline-rich domain-containing protein [Winogradskya humida]|uniref:TrbL/VirB6 plasmid conjugal transfer protein n=1 Tax=Winogradskya humida TaxID=113566 RepID=A0ABQ4A203_9ACTN|nr:proline-rich domain-containing protein [Actinoplanes humidus]GIE24889.1 hypothetical protein Ahu01nite_079910 [Actinoplanes humidus]
MPWAVHVDTVPAGGRSHWVTDCSKAVDDADRRSCWAAAVSLDGIAKAGTPSVLMDGPSTNGLAALINCGLLTGPDRSGQPSLWADKNTACLAQAARWAAQSYDPHPTVACGTTDVPCQVSKGAEEAVSSGIRSGIEGLIDLCVQGVVVLLSKLAEKVFSATAIAAPDEAFYSTYNSVAGVLVVLIFVLFVVSTVINGLRVNAGPGPLSTLGGLVRAILGVTFAGGIAYTIVGAWDQATIALLEHNAGTPFTGREWSNAFTTLAGDASTVFIAFVLSILALLGLLPLFVMMLFRGLLATGAALFGAWAMAGQAMSETRHWGRRWFWTVNALASSKFAIAALWVYGSRAGYESDLWTGLKAVLLIWLMVFAPYILLRLTAMVDGYLTDVNAHGLIAQANPVAVGGVIQDGFMNGWNANAPRDDAGGGGSSGDPKGPGSGAASVMSANSAAMPTTPGAALGEAAGGDGPNSAAADAAATGADGGKVGDPSSTTGAAGDEQTGDGDGDGATNSDEAGEVEQGMRSARHDVAAGELTAPGDSSGDGGSLPPLPQPGAQPTNPATGAPPGGAPEGGSDATPEAGGAGSPTSPETGSKPGAGGKPGPAGETGGGAGAGGASVAAEVPIVPL